MKKLFLIVVILIFQFLIIMIVVEEKMAICYMNEVFIVEKMIVILKYTLEKIIAIIEF